LLRLAFLAITLSALPAHAETFRELQQRVDQLEFWQTHRTMLDGQAPSEPVKGEMPLEQYRDALDELAKRHREGR
jgi:hypothetical protein